jgi:hypothetical protein
MPQDISAEGTQLKPPVEPMLAKLADQLPVGEYLYEPKWDGFRAIVFRGKDDLYLQSRDSRPLDRYFPEPHDMLLDRLLEVTKPYELDRIFSSASVPPPPRRHLCGKRARSRLAALSVWMICAWMTCALDG